MTLTSRTTLRARRGALRVAAAGAVLAAVTVTAPAAHAAPAVAVVGTITDSAGKPQSNITVVAKPIDSKASVHTRTAADGSYRLTVPADVDVTHVCAGGWIARSVEDPAIVPTKKEKTFNQRCTDEPVNVAAPPRRRVDLELTRRGTVSGKVVDPEGRPVAGAKVVSCEMSTGTLGQASYTDPTDSTTTAADGSFTVQMPDVRGTVKAVKEGFNGTYYGRFTCEASRTGRPPAIDMQGDTDLEGIDIMLSRPGTKLTLVSSPYIAGTPKIGWTLTARPGTWSPAAAAVDYQWLLDGEPAYGAYTSTFVPESWQAGRVLGVEVTATVPGRQPTTRIITKGAIVF